MVLTGANRRAGDVEGPGAGDRADRRAHRRFELDHRGARRVARVGGLAVEDQRQGWCGRVGGLQVGERAQVDPDVVGVVPAPAPDVGERGVAAGYLRCLPQHHPALVAGQVAALAVGWRAAHRLQRERHLPGGEPGGDPDVGERAEVVGVGHEGVPQPGAEQGVQGAGRRQRGVDVAVPGRAPLQLRVGRPARRPPVIGADLGLAALQEVRRHARHAQPVVAAQHLQRGAAGGRGVHQHQRQPGAVPLPQGQHLPWPGHPGS